MDIHDELNDIRRRAGLQEQARPHIPTVSFSEVYHVGDLDPSKKKKDSHEGAGLSFSFHPQEWSRIARLGGQLWLLSKPAGGVFIDYVNMTSEQYKELAEWGIQAGYTSPVTVYNVSWYDDEWGENMTMTFDTQEEAEEEAEGYEAPVVPDTTGLHPTPNMVKRIGWKSDNASVLDHLATIYADDNNMDGVWWDETLDVSRLSAPRGVIVPSMIKTWNAELTDGSE